jgi:hypothetical protein
MAQRHPSSAARMVVVRETLPPAKAGTADPVPESLDTAMATGREGKVWGSHSIASTMHTGVQKILS